MAPIMSRFGHVERPTPICDEGWRRYGYRWYVGLRDYYSFQLLTMAMCYIGVLAGPLRNYVMQNTSAVFERSYQAEYICVNLLRYRFMP